MLKESFVLKYQTSTFLLLIIRKKVALKQESEENMDNKITTKINVKDNLIGIMRVNNKDYISLTDLARYKK